MISYIKGRVISINENVLTIETSGIGYDIVVCENSIYNFHIDSIVELFIYSSFNQYDGSKLYGFKTLEEKKLFELLINSIPDTGPKKALDYLNKILKSINDFKKAIAINDIKILKNIFGFTPKTAQKLIDSLKDKIKDIDISDKQRYNYSIASNYDTVINALVGLGYKVSDSKNVLNDVILELGNKNIKIEELIKLCLKKLAS